MHIMELSKPADCPAGADEPESMELYKFLDLAYCHDHPNSDAEPIAYFNVGYDSMLDLIFNESTKDAELFLTTSTIDEFLKVRPDRERALTA